MIGFNVKFLVEMLGVLESDEVKIEFLIFICVGIMVLVEEIEGEEILMLVMLVMLSN